MDSANWIKQKCDKKRKKGAKEESRVGGRITNKQWEQASGESGLYDDGLSGLRGEVGVDPLFDLSSIRFNFMGTPAVSPRIGLGSGERRRFGQSCKEDFFFA